MNGENFFSNKDNRVTKSLDVTVFITFKYGQEHYYMKTSNKNLVGPAISGKNKKLKIFRFLS